MLKNILLITPLLILVSSCGSHSITAINNKKQMEPQSSNSSATKKRPVHKIAKANSDSNTDKSSLMGSAKISSSVHQDKVRSYFLYGAEHLKLENYYFDIPVVYNAAVKKWMTYFLKRGRGFFERYLERAGRYAPLLGKILEDNGLPRDLIFLAMAESGFRPLAKSWAKAVGPWQFMPRTGKHYGLKQNWYIDERRDPIKATIAASKYLKKLYGDFGSWELAASAYNAGEGKIGRAIRRYKTENFWNLRKGRYLRAETKNYVPKIMALAIIGKNLNTFGLDNITFHDPLDFEEVSVPGNLDLMDLAYAMNVTFEELQDLNPEILRWFTPPGKKSYVLRIPVGLKEKMMSMDLSRYNATAYQTYTLRSSKSRMKNVAQKFKIKDINVLKLLNPELSSHRKLKRGQVLILPFREEQSLKAPMYADLYERPRRRRSYKKRIRLAKRRGRKIASPKGFYTVIRGDSLWSVAKKNSISLDSLIVSNLKIINRRQIRAGDRLVVR